MTSPSVSSSDNQALSQWSEVCRVADVPEGDMRPFRVGDSDIVVYHAEGAFYASEDRCSHQEVALSDGTLDACIIECPLHGGSFDVTTGEVCSRPPRQPIRVYETRLEDDRLFVRLSRE